MIVEYASESDFDCELLVVIFVSKRLKLVDWTNFNGILFFLRQKSALFVVVIKQF